MRRMLAGLLLVGALGVTGCAAAGTAGNPAAAVSATASCDAAFDTASSELNNHYETHPLYGPEYDELYADGVLDDEEQDTLTKMTADEEAQASAIVDPVYDACDGWEDLYAGAFAHRDDADWSLAESEYISRDEARAIFVTAYCAGQEARPACADFDINDW